MYARAMKGLSAPISDQHDPLLYRSSGTSSFYQVRIGTDTHREADNLCGRIRRAGGACLVKRNMGDASVTVRSTSEAVTGLPANGNYYRALGASLAKRFDL
jgi:hypothetical protein